MRKTAMMPIPWFELSAVAILDDPYEWDPVASLYSVRNQCEDCRWREAYGDLAGNLARGMG